MRARSPWPPRLAEIGASLSERLVAAIATDILEGRLEAGDRLPAHRDLAWRLEIGLGTVTKAYAVLERRGLTHSIRGRGTFVARVEARGAPLIDLSINAPPVASGGRMLTRALAAVARTLDPALLTQYPPAAGFPEHRRLMAQWLETRGLNVEAGRLLLTNGGQQALSIAFAIGCRPRGLILTEAQTYRGAIALARQAGLRLRGLAMDAEGLMPEALDAALAAAAEPALLYVTPTLHNPTTATMGPSRRTAIVEICRRHGAGIVEDDVYAGPAEVGRPTLAQLAPERVIYVNSLSKTVCPGLRIGTLVVPESLVEAAEASLAVAGLSASPLSCAVLETWLSDGTLVSLCDAIRDEAERRRAIAASLLGDAMVGLRRAGFHVWLPMTRAAAERVATEARAAGIAVTPPESVMVDPDAEASGIRLCLGNPTRTDLTRGLTLLAPIVSPAAAASGTLR
ncbi:PLP-dependent aminotransferase family protein [Methylobacterium sp. E-066]|uniref:aminotransferase-like domain-containing protein n=1 Tax=Methylobacterium sp. E-066 TaxID=2836584 RepID=UPI0028C4DD18|nr:PLP-dependent aminotransferase family protein [Methylobacterium sp. E-066]